MKNNCATLGTVFNFFVSYFINSKIEDQPLGETQDKVALLLRSWQSKKRERSFYHLNHFVSLLEYNYFTVFVLGSGAFKKAMLNLSRKFQQIFFKANKIHFVQTTCRFSPHSTFISSHDSVLNKTAWSRVALFCCKWQRAMQSSPCCLCNTW